MPIFLIVFVLISWSAIGCVIAFTTFDKAEGFDYVNPRWIYKHYHVNVIGTILLTIVGSLMCPLGTIGYWAYKLCTFGR